MLSDPRVNKVTLVLVVLAAIPLFAFAGYQVGLQTGTIDPAHDHAGGGHAEEIHEQHVKHHHFMFVTAFAFIVLGVGLLAGLQPDGWWLAAWVAGVMVAYWGVAGLLAPEAASNAGTLWNVAAVAWAIIVVAAAELTQDEELPSLLGHRRRGAAGQVHASTHPGFSRASHHSASSP